MAPFLLANFVATLHFVFYLQGGLRPPYRYGTEYNVSRKLAKRNGAIIYAKAGTFGQGYLGSRVPVVLTRRHGLNTRDVSYKCTAVSYIFQHEQEEAKPLPKSTW